MTLAEWLRGWPYKGQNWTSRTGGGPIADGPDGRSAYVVADSPREHARTWAWDLDDYLVSSVTGGSIWFRPRSGSSAKRA